MSNSTEMLYLPETMTNWPWPRVINPHYEEVKAESNAWFHSLKAFSDKSQYAFDKCDFGQYNILVDHLDTSLLMMFHHQLALLL